MAAQWRMLAVAVLFLVLGGCSNPGQREVIAVGTCVVVDDSGTRPVACDAAHTHKLIAVAARPEACPPETDMSSQPADPADGMTTQCFQANTTAK